MEHLPRDNWSEYQWAREIRKDELRIHRYFKMLPSYLDLPGEDEQIFQRLMAQPELVPAGADRQEYMRNYFGFHEHDEDDSEDGSWRDDGRSRSGSEALRRLEKVAMAWNVFVVRELPSHEFKDGMAVTCGFGKLIARMNGFFDVEDSVEMQSLRVGLGKRLLSDMNDLLGALAQLAARRGTLAKQLEGFREPLNLLREAVIDLLHGLDKNNHSQG